MQIIDYSFLSTNSSYLLTSDCLATGKISQNIRIYEYTSIKPAIDRPPSMTLTEPVMKSEAGEAK